MNHRQMNALADNADAVRALAGALLTLPTRDPQVSWTDWELDFLEHMTLHQGPDPLTLRQVEVLVDLQDAARSFTKLSGLSISSLINDCWLSRFDIEDEDDQAFVSRLKASGAISLKRRQARKLLAVARQLGVVEGYVAVE